MNSVRSDDEKKELNSIREQWGWDLAMLLLFDCGWAQVDDLAPNLIPPLVEFVALDIAPFFVQIKSDLRLVLCNCSTQELELGSTPYILENIKFISSVLKRYSLLNLKKIGLI